MISLIGYTPDVFMSPWMGHLLDSNPGETGHQYVFLVLSAFAFLGLLTTILFSFLSRKDDPGHNGIRGAEVLEIH
jgi:hypothetical protein